jgi:uncharacterized DUF497 family protein
VPRLTPKSRFRPAHAAPRRWAAPKLAGLLLVVHIERGGAIRIISARRVTARERAMLERGEP